MSNIWIEKIDRRIYISKANQGLKHYNQVSIKHAESANQFSPTAAPWEQK